MTDLPPPPPRKPLILELEDEVDPSTAAPVPDDLPQGQAMQLAARIRAPRSKLARFALWAFGTFFTFALSVAAYDFVTGLFARNALLGSVAAVLLVLALLAAVLVAGREWSAYIRLARLDHLRSAAIMARQTADLKSARRTVASLVSLYTARPDTAWGRARLAEREAEVLDADALLSLAEAELLPPLDARARAEVEGAARQVAMVTALVPLALADVATALVANLRMIRRIAEIYGGRGTGADRRSDRIGRRGRRAVEGVPPLWRRCGQWRADRPRRPCRHGPVPPIALCRGAKTLDLRHREPGFGRSGAAKGIRTARARQNAQTSGDGTPRRAVERPKV